MNRTRKLALGIGAAAMVAGGLALATPALAQDDTPPSPTVECPYDADGLMHRYQHGRAGQSDQTGQPDQVRQRDRDGTCQTD